MEHQRVMQGTDARKAILDALSGHTGVSLHNILMAVPDRETALALTMLDERERERILAILSPQKRLRVREEITFQKRLFVRRDRSNKVIQRFLSHFGRGVRADRLTSYIRPM